MFKEIIKNKRPSLSESSITTYNSILTNLYKNVFGDNDSNYDYKKFNKSDKVIEHLKSLPPNKRKTVLSALFIITDDKKYRDLMISDIEDYNDEINKQEKTESQKINWVNREELNKLIDVKELNHLFKKINFIPSEYQDIQKIILLMLYSGDYIPPRRSKDYCDFKINNIDKTKDNYLKGSKMYFNSYKTSSTYGEQIVEIPNKLKMVLKKWININPTDYLFFDMNGSKLSSVKLNQRLNKLFNKKIGVNAMRKSYLTEKYKDISDRLDEINDDFTKMGSSKIQFKTYVKKD
jgi:phage-related protein